MRVGLITYQRGHKKTLDITLKLFTKGHAVTWFAFPFIERKPKPGPERYRDRPSQLMGFDPAEFCEANGVEYRPVGGWADSYAPELTGCDVYLHCTAKIVPASFIEGRTILNCHPGLLPKNRGVDAFKWSIVNGWPIGVTLHAIDSEIDRGTILYRRVVPILPCDELADVCKRAYEFECDLLANFDVHLDNLKYGWQVGDEHPISHKAIPQDLDARLEALFLEQKQRILASPQPSCTYPD